VENIIIPFINARREQRAGAVRIYLPTTAADRRTMGTGAVLVFADVQEALQAVAQMKVALDTVTERRRWIDKPEPKPEPPRPRLRAVPDEGGTDAAT
jgi:class 3 adenylate cyclase